MADEQTTTIDVAGLERTTDGTLLDQGASPSITNQTQPTTDTTTLLTEENKPTDKSTEKKPEESTKAPEKYADYTLPEGFTFDPESKGKADAIFKDLGLSQESAQKLVDFYIAQTTEAFNQPFEAYKEMTDGWRTESESHPDLRGKLGPGQEVNVRISKALDSLGDSQLVNDFKSLMNITGAGNNQAFIRVIDRFAQRLTEGTNVAGNGPSKAGQSESKQAPPSTAAALWPNLPSARP